jgi:hypothetical protein
LVIMEPWRKPNFLTLDLQWTPPFGESDDICYMTICTYFLKWRRNIASYGQHPSHQKNNFVKTKKLM